MTPERNVQNHRTKMNATINQGYLKTMLLVKGKQHRQQKTYLHVEQNMMMQKSPYQILHQALMVKFMSCYHGVTSKIL